MSETNNPASSNDKKPVVFAVPSSSTRRGINAVHVNSAREMVRLHTQGRNPPAARQSNVPSLPSRAVGASHAPTKKLQTQCHPSSPTFRFHYITMKQNVKSTMSTLWTNHHPLPSIILSNSRQTFYISEWLECIYHQETYT